MIGHIPPWQRTCNCFCPVHHHQIRVTYDNPRCSCAITCATQPVTLVVDHWACALFLTQDGDLWAVPALPDGAWDWENTEEIEVRSDFYDASVIIEHLLRAVTYVIISTRP